MQKFIAKFGSLIQGVISGADRLVVRGSLRAIGMMGCLWHKQVPLTAFGKHAERLGFGQSPAHQTQVQRTVVHQLPFRSRSSHGVLARRNRRVDRRRQVPARPSPPSHSASRSKKNSAGIFHSFQTLWGACAPLSKQRRAAERAHSLALSSLLCLGRRTVTGLLSTCGQQFQDWSAAYRLFSRERLNVENLFTGVRRAVLDRLPSEQPLCLALDDSVFRKTGPKIHGVAWRRDPLSPPFQVNLIRAQRFLQFSAAVPLSDSAPGIRMVPVDFFHAPTPAKPAPKATEDERKLYRQARRDASLGKQALLRLHAIQRSLPECDGAPRQLRLLVDGGYTNRTVLKHLPSGTTLIGRIRKDAKLYYPVTAPAEGRGRRRRYGALAPTPEQLQKDDSVAWETVKVFASGAEHQCRIKTLSGLLWRTAGADLPFKLVVIAPLHYRPAKDRSCFTAGPPISSAPTPR